MSAKRYFHTDALPFSYLEVRDRLFRVGKHGLLSRYKFQLFLRELNALTVVLYVAESGVNGNFDEFGDLIDVFIVEFLDKSGDNRVGVHFLDSVNLCHL